MEKTTKRLGRGLDALIGTAQTRVSFDRTMPDVAPAATTEVGADEPPRTIAIDRLVPNPFQPRGAITDDQVRSLADSIRNSGIIQPITVRKAGERFEIIAGERRWRAARLAGLSEVPIIVREADDAQLIEIAIIENVQREDLNAIDRASAYKAYCDRFNVSPEVIAQRLGEDRSTVTNYVRLLGLPPAVREKVASGELPMGHARCLLSISDNAERERVAELAIAKGWSVRTLEGFVRRERGRGRSDPQTALASARKPANIRDVEQQLEQVLSTKVTIREGRKKGSGRLIIEFYTLDDFDRIAARLGFEPE